MCKVLVHGFCNIEVAWAATCFLDLLRPLEMAQLARNRRMVVFERYNPFLSRSSMRIARVIQSGFLILPPPTSSVSRRPFSPYRSSFTLYARSFNREIASVRWPPKLSKLEFCGELQQKIEEVAWPGSLTHLALLGDFDQPVHAVQWPSGLVTIRFGDRFQQPLAGVTSWPPRLETVVLGTRYGKSLSGCVLLPSPDGESAGGLQLQVRRTDGGDGGGSVAGAGSKVGAPDKHPSLVDAFLRVVVSRGDDGHTGDDSSCVGIDDACCGDPSTMAVRHAEEPTLHAVEVWDQHRLPMEGGVPDEEEMLSVGDVGTDADVDHERYWDEDDADGGGDGQGLPYVDVFEVEDVAWDWDVEDPCLSLPGTY